MRILYPTLPIALVFSVLAIDSSQAQSDLPPSRTLSNTTQQRLYLFQPFAQNLHGAQAAYKQAVAATVPQVDLGIAAIDELKKAGDNRDKYSDDIETLKGYLTSVKPDSYLVASTMIAIKRLMSDVRLLETSSNKLVNTRKIVSMAASGLPFAWTVSPGLSFGDGSRSWSGQVMYDSGEKLAAGFGNITLGYTNQAATNVTTNQLNVVYDPPAQHFGRLPGLSYSPEVGYTRTFSGALANDYAASLELDFTPTVEHANDGTGEREQVSLWTVIGQINYDVVTGSGASNAAALAAGIGYSPGGNYKNFGIKAIYAFPNVSSSKSDVTVSLQDQITTAKTVGIGIDRFGSAQLTLSFSFR